MGTLWLRLERGAGRKETVIGRDFGKHELLCLEAGVKADALFLTDRLVKGAYTEQSLYLGLLQSDSSFSSFL